MARKILIAELEVQISLGHGVVGALTFAFQNMPLRYSSSISETLPVLRHAGLPGPTLVLWVLRSRRRSGFANDELELRTNFPAAIAPEQCEAARRSVAAYDPQGMRFGKKVFAAGSLVGHLSAALASQ